MAERKKQKMEERERKTQERLKGGLETWDPSKDEKVVGDPYKTLHVSRLSFDVTEKDLRREFSMYGQIENIKVVKDLESKARGYAFIEFEREKDMKAAYKDADGIKVLGRRIVVDVERGRTGEHALGRLMKIKHPQEETIGMRGRSLAMGEIVPLADAKEVIKGMHGVMTATEEDTVVGVATTITTTVAEEDTAIGPMNAKARGVRAGAGREAPVSPLAEDSVTILGVVVTAKIDLSIVCTRVKQGEENPRYGTYRAVREKLLTKQYDLQVSVP
ncbi:hypothetical protein BGZ65_003867, partial [Modicella reniformis]